MYLARILYPVKVLGPGNRVAIWFNGCEHRCKGCSNPELWKFNDKFKTSKEVIVDLIDKIAKNENIDGFTLTGGDPFYQEESLNELLPILYKYSKDILIYTGYLFNDIKNKYPELLNYIAVIIDGPYVEERNNNCFLRGSDNQNIFLLNNDLKEKYEIYLKDGKNEIQNFLLKDGLISVGIHKPNFNSEILKKCKEKGVEIDG